MAVMVVSAMLRRGENGAMTTSEKSLIGVQGLVKEEKAND